MLQSCYNYYFTTVQLLYRSTTTTCYYTPTSTTTTTTISTTVYIYILLLLLSKPSTITLQWFVTLLFLLIRATNVNIVTLALVYDLYQAVQHLHILFY